MRGGITARARELLLRWSRAWMIAVASFAGVIIVASYALDEGEVVTVETVDARDREHVTEVWIVDLPSGTYLRAGSPDAAWLERVRNRPEIVLTRGDERSRVRAIVEDEDGVRARVNAAMAEKYGLADALWTRVSDHGAAVPIRLEPTETAAAKGVR